MKIEWASHFRSDGSRRNPPPSTMHGWLAKMRGTLLGNEDLRSKGMQEMRAARRYKQDKRSRPKPKSKSIARRDTGPSHLFGSLSPKPSQSHRPPQYRSTSTHRVVGRPPPRRASHQSSHRSGSSRQPTPSRQSSKPTPRRRDSAR
ncbi:hypothetical protein R3P38DRAFT_2832155 [Favolaschia claudopus]|uniref:Uncharacterized protein n=1 Tax=Favolaschia claudopus TaxID=2862362 RepID=A0AAW0EEN1_9AGAR